MHARKTYIAIGISSTIGFALAQNWRMGGARVIGTFNTPSDKTEALKELGCELFQLNVTDKTSIESFINSAQIDSWDCFTYLPGSLHPVSSFDTTDFDQWEASFQINFFTGLRILRSIIDKAQINAQILLWAGGGVNSATQNVSSYTTSKIALIKMTEILDFELTQQKATILGPGWIDAPIHKTIIDAGKEKAGNNYANTLDKYESQDFTPIEQVIDCVNWVIGQPKQVVGGRNISVAHDNWGSEDLEDALISRPSMFKLRRNSQ